MIPIVSSLAAVADRYEVLLVDVWGVVHNGVRAFPEASEALSAARSRGACAILISNAPRLSSEIPLQLDRLGVPRSAYDAVATSGDAARRLIEAWVHKGFTQLHHIGPDRDLSLFAGLDAERVPLASASHVVCTGPFDDEIETPDDYTEQLSEIVARKLPFLCANPDLVVQRGDRLIYCAGALALRLEQLGGTAIYVGKPHAPIYELAIERASALLARGVKKSELLAIGDGLRTDILGAARFGIASVLIAEGIHGAELRGVNGVDAAKLEQLCAEAGVAPIAVMSRLQP